MDLRSALLHISLVIFHLINVGQASSDDGGNRSVEGGKHKWTTDEELKLIFFDVSTDTGKRKHFNRIKEEWRKEYPKSNVTDEALKHKLCRLRKESTEEGELKKYFKWNEELERELIDVYITTHPNIRGASISLEEEWKRRHPDSQVTAKSILQRVRMIFKKYKNLRYRKLDMSGGSSHIGDEEKVRELRHHWTEDETAMLLHFYNLTNTGEPDQLNRMKLMWREEYPKSNVTDDALLRKFQKLRRTFRNKVPPMRRCRKYYKWTPEEERVLLDTYLNTYLHGKNVSTTFEEAWKQRTEGSQATKQYLVRRARKLIKENRYPEYSERVLLEKNPQSRHREGPESSYASKLKSRRSGNLPSGDSEGESQAESSRMRIRKRNKYIPKMRSLEEISGGQMEAEPGKRHGKAPMVYASDGSESSPPVMTSEDSG